MQHHPNRLSGAFDGLVLDNGRTTVATLYQQQIQTEIQRFESVHPRIYQIYDLLKKLRSDQGRQAELIEQIQEQVIGIEDAFVNSQEWTIGRTIHEIRVGVIGSEDSCKNSLIHYFLTRNWNWEDAPEGGRFKKEVFIDGLSYLLLIRDEGSREPNVQFSHWFDALLIVFAIESHQSFNAALELHKKVHYFRPLDSGDVPVYLIGMRNMSQMAQKRAISESDAERMSKLLKMANHFECADGSSVLRTFNNVCQRVVQQRVLSRGSSSLIGIGHEYDKPSVVAGTSSHHRHSGHYHQRSVSVLPLNNDQQHALFPPASSFPLGGGGGTASTAALRSRIQRNDAVGNAVPSCSSSSCHNNNAIFHAPQSSSNSTNFRNQLNSYASFTPNSSSNTNIMQQNNSRRRESMDQLWSRSTAAHHNHHSNQQQKLVAGSPYMVASIPSAPSCSALVGARCTVVEPLTSSTISPAFSHNNLSNAAAQHQQQQHNIGFMNNNHYASSNTTNAMPSSNMMVAASPYTRSASSVIHSHAARYGSDQQHQTTQQHQHCFYPDGSMYNNNNSTLVDPGGSVHGLHSLSTATSSSTLVVNNGNGNTGGNAATTPGSTPNTQRKQHRRISNIFRKDNNLNTQEERIAKSSADINLGVGRAIPIKQDYLYKKSKNGLNREWKKKYVCLYSDGRICYHQNLKEYAEKDSRGKEIYLGLATVRTSDRHRPKCGGGAAGNGTNSNRNSLLTSSTTTTTTTIGAKDALSPLLHDRSNDASMSNAEEGAAYFCPRSPLDAVDQQQQQFSDCVSDSCGDGGVVAAGASAGNGGGALATSTSSSLLMDNGKEQQQAMPSSANVMAATNGSKNQNGGGSGGKKEKQKEKKKRAKRIGSGGKNDEDDECCEFELVSCDQKRWEFSARSVEERDEWVSAIEREIERCLQQQLSLKDQQQMGNNNGWPGNGCGGGQSNGGISSSAAAAASFTARSERARTDIRALRRLPGNGCCADCGALTPDWAAINFGTLICIECSGIHRMLGSHISKVRSLELDDWPPEHLMVMQAIGNAMANRIWQHNAPEKEKPTADASREQKEQWIRTIYVKKLYLPSIPVDRTLRQQLVEAVLCRNIEQLLTVLPRCEKEDVNAQIDFPKDRRTVVHLACGIGAPEILQLLIWYNADLHALDEHGRNALWHANLSGSTECAAILVQQGGLQSEQQQKHSPR